MSQDKCFGGHKENYKLSSPDKQIKKLQVLISDQVFELRKMEEDHAEQKASMTIQFNKERTTMNAAIKDLKCKIVEENERWSEKIEELRAQYEEKMKQNSNEWEAKISELVESKMIINKKEFEVRIKELEESLEKLTLASHKDKRENYEKIESLNKIKIEALSHAEKEKQELIEETKAKLREEETAKIHLLIQSNKNEEREHQNTKQLLLKKEENHKVELANLEDKIFNFNEQIDSLKNKVYSLSKKEEQQAKEIDKMSSATKIAIENCRQECSEKIAMVELEKQKNIEILNEKWANEYHKVQEVWLKVENACAEKEKLFEERIKKALENENQREGRESDIKYIECLEHELEVKGFELEREKQEVRFCKLEIDNLDEVHKRFFKSSEKRKERERNLSTKSAHAKKVHLPAINSKSNKTLDIKEI